MALPGRQHCNRQQSDHSLPSRRGGLLRHAPFLDRRPWWPECASFAASKQELFRTKAMGAVRHMCDSYSSVLPFGLRLALTHAVIWLTLFDQVLTLRCRAGGGTPTADGEETWSTWDILFNRDNVLADNDISNCNRQGNDGGVIESWGVSRNHSKHCSLRATSAPSTPEVEPYRCCTRQALTLHCMSVR